MRRVVAALVTGAVLLTTAPTVDAAPVARSRDWVVVIGDFGSRSPAEADVARLVARLRPAAIVTTGDNLYSATTYAEAVGAYYCPYIAQAPTSVPCPSTSMASANAFFPATGNHDYSDGGLTNYLGYFRALAGRTTYAVTRGGIEFLVVDSQAALDSADSMQRQREWVRARALSSKARWQVVVLHHPPYSSSAVHGSSTEFRWPFGDWGVDLVLSGHDHDYERLDVDGTAYVVDGTGGADLYPFGPAVPGSLVRDDRHHGALILRGTRAGLLGEYWTTDGVRRDRFAIRRANP
jgi:tartrate-resistant acid phosphatase type 5